MCPLSPKLLALWVCFLVILVGCGSPGSSNAERVGSSAQAVTGVTLKSIAVSPTPSKLFEGATVQLSASGSYKDGTTQDLTQSVAWTSSNTAVAAVSAAGLVTAIGKGSATITATDGTVKGKASITVPLTMTSLAVTPGSTTLPAHTTQAVKATASYDNNTTKNVTTAVTWTSSNPAVATVSSTGLVVTVAPGTATLQASSTAASSAPVVGTAAIVVNDATVTQVMVAPATKKLPLGTTQRLTATATYSDATTMTLSAPVVSWTSSNPAVATVSGAGVVSAVTVGGPVTITASPLGSSVTGGSTVTVTGATLKSIAVTPAGSSVVAGLAEQLAATGTYSDGSTADLTSQVTWTTSLSGSVANVSSTGLVTGQQAGSGTVTAAIGKITATVALTVTPAVLASLAITPVSPMIPVGTSLPFAAEGTWTDGSTADVTASVTWSSSDTSVASVSGGLVSGLARGTATVTATDPTTQVTQSVTVLITPPVLEGIAVTPSNPVVPAGTSAALSATGTYSDGSTQDITAFVIWSSSGPAIAVANSPGPAGQATAVSAGSAVVSATDGTTGIVGQTTVTTGAPLLVSIAVSPVTANIPAGLTQAFIATGTFTDGSTQDVSASVQWSSSAPGVAAFLGAPGVATGVSQGVATVTATDPASAISAGASVDVVGPVALALSLSPSSVALLTGQTQRVVATATMSDGSTTADSAVTWQSSAPAAFVTGGGLVVGISVGDAVVTATDPGGATASVGVAVAVNLDDDAAVEFSAYVNPVSNWTFGSAPSVGGAVAPFANAYTDAAGEAFWTGAAPGDVPAVVENVTSSPQAPYGTTSLAPGQLAMVASSTGGEGVSRWTAPQTGVYQVNATFTGPSGPAVCAPVTTCVQTQVQCNCVSCNCNHFGCDTCCSSTCTQTECASSESCSASPPLAASVAVLRNGSPVFGASAYLDGAAETLTYRASVAFNAGDTLDFEVGGGGTSGTSDLVVFDARVATCASAGLTACGNVCTNTQTDANNCGACGTKCAADCNAGTCVAGPGFVSGAIYTGEQPFAVAVADLDGNGTLDLVETNQGGNAINSFDLVTFLRNGDGSFRSLTYSIASPAAAIAFGDFNGDGKLDVAAGLAAWNGKSGGAAVLLGNGDGTFQSPVAYALAGSAYAIANGDFNGDGHADLALATFSGVALLLGNGDGTFSLAPTLSAPSTNAFDMVAADFDQNGTADLALPTSSGVAVLLGNGDATFRAAATYAAGSGPNFVATSDFNGDGHVDLAVTNSGGAVSVLLGNGDGTFQAPANFVVGTIPSAVAVADFNADGRVDLAVLNEGSTTSPGVSILLGNGDGTFQGAANYGLAQHLAPYWIAAGDFDGDGLPDFVTASENGGGAPFPEGALQIFLKTGNGP